MLAVLIAAGCLMLVAVVVMKWYLGGLWEESRLMGTWLYHTRSTPTSRLRRLRSPNRRGRPVVARRDRLTHLLGKPAKLLLSRCERTLQRVSISNRCDGRSG